VHYCEDAFEGLRVLRTLEGEGRVEPAGRSRASARPRVEPRAPSAGAGLPAPEVDRSVPIPTPPFLGARVLPELPLDEVLGQLNETTLIRGQWRYRRGTLTREEYDDLLSTRVRPLLEALRTEARRGDVIRPAAVYGWWPCRSEGRDLVLLDPGSGAETARFSFPRRRVEPHWCIADFFHPEGPDVVGLFVVTAGAAAAAHIRRLFEEDAYRDYLHWHGFAVEAAEAAAEWLHGQMRRELGIGDGDLPDPQAVIRQGYRGSRYSFGYPACPELESQETLFRLLDPGRIGVSLTEGFQMVPEQSVSAVVAHHPAARYFHLE
ncbi:MAG: hypothetical protein FJ098_08855, partial [Deltaproteobacteria bacterium]|nr:hypothetical protein [Deltaproteobacteria bacterium]